MANMTEQERHLLTERAAILKALAHPTRLWIVELLAKKEQCVCTFVDGANVDFSTISKHLSVLKQAGIVTDRKEGKQVYYTLKIPCILNFMECVDAVIQGKAASLQKCC
ncbi:MAG: ArsR/SmtB family transcription factor [Saezia sp.]